MLFSRELMYLIFSQPLLSQAAFALKGWISPAISRTFCLNIKEDDYVLLFIVNTVI